MTVDQGKSSRTVVQGLIHDMHKFSDFVQAEIITMIRQTDQLAESWNDPQYEQFSEFIYNLSESIAKDLRVFDEATNALQKKLDMYNQ